jgi:outer membrane protein TolC
MKFLCYASFLLLVVFCGCQTVKQARQAQSAADRLPGETTVTAAQAGLESGRTYALTNLEQIALSYHPALLQARQAVESARQQCRIVHAGRLPQISASGTYNRSTQNASGRRPNASEMRGSWSGSLGLDLLLYDFGRLDAQERQALEGLIAAEAQLRLAEIETSFNVRIAFCDFHRSEELYRVALESVKQYAQHLDEARTMVEVGTRRKYDATKAEVDWGNARMDVITYSNALRVTRAQLNNALGLAAAPAYVIGEGGMPPHPEEVDALIAVARENAPSLAVLRARERAASAFVDQSVADLYPDLSLGADASLSGRGFPLAWNYSWFLRATQSLFDGHRRTARITDAVTQLRAARSRVAEEEQAIYLALMNAVTQRESAKNRLEISELIQRQALENLAIVNEQYRVGVSSSIERTDAQVTVTQAMADVVRAHFDGQAACARIAQLIGEAVSLEAPAENK